MTHPETFTYYDFSDADRTVTMRVASEHTTEGEVISLMISDRDSGVQEIWIKRIDLALVLHLMLKVAGVDSKKIESEADEFEYAALANLAEAASQRYAEEEEA